MVIKTRPKIGLVLGSGGFRGLAHLGVLKVLHQNKIPLDYIAGTSIGALFGAAYALTQDIEEIEKRINKIGWLKTAFLIIDPALFWHRGLLEGRGLEDFIYSFVQDKSFHETKIPFECVACELETGNEVILNKGRLTLALRASMSAPFWFKPLFLDGHLLVDGDLVNPLPVNLAQEANCHLIIASSINDQLLDPSYKWRGIPKLTPLWEKIFGDKNYWRRHKYHFFSLLARTNNIVRQKLVQISLDQADIKITPRVSHRSVIWSKIYNIKENIQRVIQIGEEAARSKLEEIKSKIWN